MKTRLFIVITLIISVNFITYSTLYITPQNVNIKAFPAHVEISWDNHQGFSYDIYRAFDSGTKKLSYEKIVSTSDDYYLDFFNHLNLQIKKIHYRLIPTGLNINTADLNSLEFSVTPVKKTDEALLDMTQRYTTRYFTDFADPNTGMARERSNDINGNIITTGGTGFGIMAIIAGMERDYVSKEEGIDIISKIVTFLEKAERFHGAWAHWYDASTGEVFNFSKYDDGGDIVETALLTQGLLTARQYLLTETIKEIELSNKITDLWESIEWNWYTQGTDTLYWHWSKNHAWKMNHKLKGFDETFITYVLAAASPTYPIEKNVYESTFKNSTYYYNGKSYYGIKLQLGMEYGGPLFFSHYSFLGLNPHLVKDNQTDYFQRNKNHALIHRAYAIDNPKNHEGYGSRLWGFTSSDDPLVGYSNHHPNTEADNGTVSPTAAISSIVYTPEESLEVLKHLYYDKGNQLFGKYGFYDAYNPSLVYGQQVVKSYLAIDQGPIAVMIENYRSSLIWDLFMSNDEIKKGLKKLGF